MHFGVGEAHFGRTATHFVNMFCFCNFLGKIKKYPFIFCLKYGDFEVLTSGTYRAWSKRSKTIDRILKRIHGDQFRDDFHFFEIFHKMGVLYTAPPIQ